MVDGMGEGKDLCWEGCRDVVFTHTIPFFFGDCPCVRVCSQASPQPCLCPVGYKGPHCEYEETAVKDCTLSCQNGGLCRLGESSSPGYNVYFWEQDDLTDHMHCECPEGWTGPDCTIETIKCGPFECLNGSACVEREDFNDDGSPFCDCQSANDFVNNVFYAGKYCQYLASEICAIDSGTGQAVVCANGGACRQDAPDGCDCPPGVGGQFCEYSEEFDCTLDCQNGSICRLGPPPPGLEVYDYQFDTEYHHEFQYCECASPDFRGMLCEITDENQCGNVACLNGGTCETEVVDGEIEFFCNCNSAYDSNRGIQYGGRYCQSPSSALCFEDTVNQEIYSCFNSGQCQSEYTNGCACPEEYGGFSCEYVRGRDCTLTCQNGGVCALGPPLEEYSYLSVYWFSPDKDYQYCECPEGFSGEFCQAEAVDCGDFLCLNGGQCSDEEGNPMEDRCNCIDAYDFLTDTYFDGLYCQFPSTSVCFEDATEAFFCMNGGECQDDYLQGCKCPEGFGGFYCEFDERLDCQLDCGENGTCRLGSPPRGSQADAYWYNPDADGSNQYCECDQGSGGKFCESFGEDCGDYTCLNGGSCTAPDGNPMVDRCNCLDAWEEATNTFYDGRFCQYASTVICSEDQNEIYFCVNDGVCRTDARQGCLCEDGFSGFSCEFITGTDCTLDCGRNGVCRLGDQSGQYCECAPLFTGDQCQFDVILPSESPSATPSASPSTVAPTSMPSTGTNCTLDCGANGTCRLSRSFASNSSNQTIDIDQYCECNPLFSGPFCDTEVVSPTASPTVNCTLDCGANGTCLLGSPLAAERSFATTNDTNVTTAIIEQDEYCKCDPLFVGEFCQTQVTAPPTTPPSNGSSTSVLTENDESSATGLAVTRLGFGAFLGWLPAVAVVVWASL